MAVWGHRSPDNDWLRRICVALVACGGSKPTPVTTIAPPIPTPDAAVTTVATPPQTVPSAPQIVATVSPMYDQPRLVESSPKRVLAFAGSLRAEFTPKGVELAEDLFVDAIVAATAVKDGWVFASADGSFARADTFLGALTYLGDAPRELATRTSVGRSCERLARGAGDMLYSTTGHELETSKAPGVVVAAAFANAQFGAVVLDGGALYVTHDAGATFAATDLVVTELGCEAGKLRVKTSTATVSIGSDGTRDVSARQPFTPLDEDLRIAFRRNALRRWPEVGAFAATWPDARRCTHARWGADTVFVCDSPPQAPRSGAPYTSSSTAYRVKDGELSTEFSGVHGYASFSDDGVHAAWSCTERDPNSRARPPEVTCVYDGRTVTRRPGGTLGRMVHGVTNFAFHNRTFISEDVRTGADRRTIALAQVQPGSVASESVTGDGEYAIGLRYLYDRKTEVITQTDIVFVGLARGDVALVALPAGTSRVGFVDRKRGLAAGADLAKLLRTEDGGATWIPLELATPPIPAQRTSTTPRWLPDREIACRGTKCIVDHRVEVDFAATPGKRAANVVGSRRDVDALRVTDPNLLRKLACTGDGVSSRSPPDAGRLAWSGEDLRGPFHVGSAAARPLRGNRVEYDVISQTRNGTLLTRNTGEAYDRVWYAAGGNATVLDDKPLADTWLIVDAIDAPDGGAIAIAIERTDQHSVLAIDRAGRITAKRQLAWQLGSDTDVLAAFVDQPGAMIAQRSTEGPRTFVALDGTTRAIPAVETLPVCTSRAAGALSAIATRGMKEDVRWRARRLYVRSLDSADACIAGIGVHSLDPGPRGDRMILPAKNGRFASKSLTCTLEAP
jgi:hypothetical protein